MVTLRERLEALRVEAFERRATLLRDLRDANEVLRALGIPAERIEVEDPAPAAAVVRAESIEVEVEIDDHNDSSRRCSAAVEAIVTKLREHPDAPPLTTTSDDLLPFAGINDVTTRGLTRRLARIADGRLAHPHLRVERAHPRRENERTVWRLSLKEAAATPRAA